MQSDGGRCWSSIKALVSPVKAESAAPAGEPAMAHGGVTGVAPRLVEVERHKSKARCLLMFSFNFHRVSSLLIINLFFLFLLFGD